MLFLFLFALFLVTLRQLQLLKLFAPVSSAVFEACLNRSSYSNHFEFTSALICGRNIENDSLRALLISVGLYHLVVVSCSHLEFVDSLVAKFFSPKSKFNVSARWIIWSFILIATQFQAPILRAWCARSLSLLNQKWRFNASAMLILALSVGLCAALDPGREAWGFSLLLSSWSILGLTLSQQLRQAKLFRLKPDLLQDSIVVWLVLAIPLAGFSNHPPETIFFNLFLAPIFGFVLFPMALLGFLMPFTFPVYDWILDYFLSSLSHLSLSPQLHLNFPSPQAQAIAWLAWGLAWLCLYLLQQARRQQRLAQE